MSKNGDEYRKPYLTHLTAPLRYLHTGFQWFSLFDHHVGPLDNEHPFLLRTHNYRSLQAYSEIRLAHNRTPYKHSHNTIIDFNMVPYLNDHRGTHTDFSISRE